MATLIGGRRAHLASAGAACVAVVAGVGLLLRGVTPPADAWVLDHWYAAPGTAAARVATVVGGAGTLLLLGLLVAGAVGVWRRHRAEAPALLARTLLLLLLCGSVLALQGVVGRAGPPQQPEAGTYPSGHATVVAAALLAAAVLYARLGRAWLRAAAGAGGTLLLLVCVSRMVLAEHWLLDVAAGLIATTGAAGLAAALLRLGPGARPV